VLVGGKGKNRPKVTQDWGSNRSAVADPGPESGQNENGQPVEAARFNRGETVSMVARLKPPPAISQLEGRFLGKYPAWHLQMQIAGGRAVPIALTKLLLP
jgi:hypothetical protein